MATTANISKKRKFIREGVFHAELNEFFTRELAEDGYSGLEVRVTPQRTEIIIMATKTQQVLGEKGRRIRELTSVIQKRFGYPENSIELFAQKVVTRGLCAIAQAESLRYKLMGGLPVRRACYGVLRYIMESGAQGCEIIVSGKLRGQRAKAMKFIDGLMIHSGDPVNDYVQFAVRHVLLRQGVLGIKVKIMLPYDTKESKGAKKTITGSYFNCTTKRRSTNCSSIFRTKRKKKLKHYLNKLVIHNNYLLNNSSNNSNNNNNHHYNQEHLEILDIKIDNIRKKKKIL